MPFTNINNMPDLEFIRMYKEALWAEDEPLRKSIQDNLFTRFIKIYSFLAIKTWKGCGIRTKEECIGWLAKSEQKQYRWQTGLLSLGIAKAHREALDKYHLMPNKLSRKDFEEKILLKVTEEEANYLNKLYCLEHASGKYILKSDTPENSLRRWTIASRIGFMVAKPSTYIFTYCFRVLYNYCKRECSELAEIRKQIGMLETSKYQSFLTAPALTINEKNLIGNLYQLDRKTGDYKLKRAASVPQIVALCHILSCCPSTLSANQPDHSDNFEGTDRLFLQDVSRVIISHLHSLPDDIEQKIFYLFMQDKTQKEIGSLLRLSEVNVCRKIRRMEKTITGKIRDALEIKGQSPEYISLEVLKDVEIFRTLYAKQGYPLAED